MEQIPLIKLLNPAKPFQSLWTSRELLLQIVLRDIKSRYRASMFGLFWMMATPLFMLAVYTFVFSVIFKARWGDGFGDSKTAFALIIFCGFSVFNIFSEGISTACTVITSNQNFVKKVVFPLEILPAASVLTATAFGLIWMFILVAGILVFFHKLFFTAICLPLILLPLILITIGLAWFLASVGTFFRDLQHAIGIIVQALFFMSPIIYPLEMVPERMRTVLRLNPLTTVIEQTRQVLLFGHWPDWAHLVVLTAISLVIFHLGYIWFMKTRRGFADVV